MLTLGARACCARTGCRRRRNPQRHQLLRRNLFAELPRLYAQFEDQLAANFPEHDDWSLPPFFKIGSWIGGDRDGNPFVTADILRAGLPPAIDGGNRSSISANSTPSAANCRSRSCSSPSRRNWKHWPASRPITHRTAPTSPTAAP